MTKRSKTVSRAVKLELHRTLEELASNSKRSPDCRILYKHVYRNVWLPEDLQHTSLDSAQYPPA